MSDAAPLVSVIIPNHNYGGYLSEAIDSALAQTHRSLEVLVVDDGSTDQSSEVLRRYEGRLRVIRQARGGVAAARNRGAQESRGELLAFLDADDRWLPQKLQRQLERLRHDPALGLVHCGARLIDAAGHRLAEVMEGVAGRVVEDLLFFRRAGVVTGGSGMLLSRQVFEEAGGFDTRLSTSADWDFFFRVGLRRPFGFVAEPLVQMRVHERNMRSNIPAMEHDMLLAFEKAFQNADPALRRVRRACYGNLHLILAGSFFQAGQPLPCLRHALAGLRLTPSAGVRVAAFPLRWTQRRLSRIVPEDGRRASEAAAR